MNSPAVPRAFVPLVPLPFLLLPAAAESDLRYLLPGTTNAYGVTIESAGENNPRRFEGIFPGLRGNMPGRLTGRRMENGRKLEPKCPNG